MLYIKDVLNLGKRGGISLLRKSTNLLFSYPFSLLYNYSKQHSGGAAAKKASRLALCQSMYACSSTVPTSEVVAWF